MDKNDFRKSTAVIRFDFLHKGNVEDSLDNLLSKFKKCSAIRNINVISIREEIKATSVSEKEGDYVGELWDADPKCKHEVVCASGGGVKCTKCKGWFCY